MLARLLTPPASQELGWNKVVNNMENKTIIGMGIKSPQKKLIVKDNKMQLPTCGFGAWLMLMLTLVLFFSKFYILSLVALFVFSFLFSCNIIRVLENL